MNKEEKIVNKRVEEIYQECLGKLTCQDVDVQDIEDFKTTIIPLMGVAYTDGVNDCNQAFLMLIKNKGNGIHKIEKNFNMSFFGTISSALKNGYNKDKKYVIIDRDFFEKLYRQEEELSSAMEEKK